MGGACRGAFATWKSIGFSSCGGTLCKVVACVITLLLSFRADAGVNGDTSVTWESVLEKAASQRLRLDSYAVQVESKGFNLKDGKPILGGRFESRFWQSGDLWDVATTSYLLGDDHEYHRRGTLRRLWDGRRTWGRHDLIAATGREIVRGSVWSTNTGKLSMLEGDAARLDGTAYGDREPYYEILMKSADMGQIALAPEKEEISGNPCYVIEAKCAHGYYKVWIDPENGYNFRRLIVRKSANDLSGDKPLSEVSVMREFEEELTISRIAQVAGFYVPMVGHMEVRGRNAKGREEHFTLDVERSNIDLKPDFDALGAFRMGFPDGTDITDEETGIVYLWQQGRLVPRDVETIAKGVTDLLLSQGVGEDSDRAEHTPVLDNIRARKGLVSHYGDVPNSTRGGNTGCLILVVASGAVVMVALAILRQVRRHQSRKE